MSKEQLFEAAKAVIHHAYAPYSKFQVAAAIQTATGEIYAGVNVENAAYPMGNCAETSAIAQCVTQSGAPIITHVLVMAEAHEPLTPCGGCLQKISEFASDGAIVYSANPTHIINETLFSALFPKQFGHEYFEQ